jgi:hypothetical protein
VLRSSSDRGFAWVRERSLYDVYDEVFREKKKCDALSCRMAAGKFNLVMLVFSTIVVVMAIAFYVFPGLIAPLLM